MRRLAILLVSLLAALGSAWALGSGQYTILFPSGRYTAPAPNGFVEFAGHSVVANAGGTYNPATTYTAVQHAMSFWGPPAWVYAFSNGAAVPTLSALYAKGATTTANMAGNLTSTNVWCDFGGASISAACLSPNEAQGATAAAVSIGSTSFTVGAASFGTYNTAGQVYYVAIHSGIYFDFNCQVTISGTGAPYTVSFASNSPYYNGSGQCQTYGTVIPISTTLTFIPVAEASNFGSYTSPPPSGTIINAANGLVDVDQAQNTFSWPGTSMLTDPAKTMFIEHGANDSGYVNNVPSGAHVPISNIATTLDAFGPSGANKSVLLSNERPQGANSSWSIATTATTGEPEILCVGGTCGSAGAGCTGTYCTSTLTKGASLVGPNPVDKVFYAPCGAGAAGTPTTTSCGATGAPAGAYAAGAGDGVALTLVASNPAQGQYAVNTGTGALTFNQAGDAGARILVWYRWTGGTGSTTEVVRTIRDWENDNWDCSGSFVDTKGNTWNYSGATCSRPWVHVANTFDAMLDPATAPQTSTSAPCSAGGANCGGQNTVAINGTYAGNITTGMYVRISPYVSGGTTVSGVSGSGPYTVALSANLKSAMPAGTTVIFEPATSSAMLPIQGSVASMNTGDNIHPDVYGSHLIGGAEYAAAQASGAMPTSPLFAWPTSQSPNLAFTGSIGSSTTSATGSCAGTINGGTTLLVNGTITALSPAINGLTQSQAQALYPPNVPIVTNQSAASLGGHYNGLMAAICWDTANNKIAVGAISGGGQSGSVAFAENAGLTSVIVNDTNALVPNSLFTYGATNGQGGVSTAAIPGCGTSNVFCTWASGVTPGGIETATSGSNSGTTLNVASTQGVQSGMAIYLAGSTSPTSTVASINSLTQITSAASLGSTSNATTVTFSGATNQEVVSTNNGKNGGAYPNGWIMVWDAATQTAISNGTLGAQFAIEQNPFGTGQDDFLIQLEGYWGASGGPSLTLKLSSLGGWGNFGGSDTGLMAVGDMHRAGCKISIGAGPNGRLYGLAGAPLELQDVFGATTTAVDSKHATYTNMFSIIGSTSAGALTDYDLQPGLTGVSNGLLSVPAVSAAVSYLAAQTTFAAPTIFTVIPTGTHFGDPVSATIRISQCWERKVPQ